MCNYHQIVLHPWLFLANSFQLFQARKKQPCLQKLHRYQKSVMVIFVKNYEYWWLLVLLCLQVWTKEYKILELYFSLELEKVHQPESDSDSRYFTIPYPLWKHTWRYIKANAAEVANFPSVDNTTRGQCPQVDGTSRVVRQANPEPEIKICIM